MVESFWAIFSEKKNKALSLNCSKDSIKKSFQLTQIRCLVQVKFSEAIIQTKSLKCVIGLEATR